MNEQGSREVFTRRLAEWLPGRRWFGGKGRRIADLAVFDRTTLESGGPPTLLALVDVTYEQGAPERYFVPLLVGGDGAEPADALADPAASNGLLAAVARGERLPTERGGTIVFSRGPAFESLHRARRDDSARPLGVEQSNSSVVYGEAIFLKCFRRVYDGPNPDLEVPRFLATRTAFDSLPRLAGSIEYEGPAGQTASLGVLQEFVASEGDGWGYTLRALADGAGDACLTRLADLGRVTAELHLALASDPDDPDFAPRPITADDLAAWHNGVLDWVEAAFADLERALKAGGHSDEVESLAARLMAGGERVGARIEGLLNLRPGEVDKTRYHGDYHLGQVLRAAGGWLVLDFEGEPLRSLAERRARHCPLKDAAGMLRSFNYARHAALREQPRVSPGALAGWEAAVRAAYLDAYFERAGAASFLPRDRAAAEAVLRTFELEKAAYELRYELNNRPDWVPIPLAFLAQLAEEPV